MQIMLQFAEKKTSAGFGTYAAKTSGRGAVNFKILNNNPEVISST